MSLDKYKIIRRDDVELTPEETLVDATSEHAFVELPISNAVFTVVSVGIGIVFLVLLIRAFSLQISHGRQYADVALQSTLSQYPIPSARGAIYDRNNQPLVENIPVFDVVVVRSELLRAHAEISEMIDRAARLLGESDEDVKSTFNRNKDNGVFVLAAGISKERAVAIQSVALPGIYVVSYAQRHYPLGLAAAHLLGYTAKVSSDELQQDEFYVPTDRVGRIGLEAQYETILRGQHQSIVLKKGRTDPGENTQSAHVIITTIDRNVQQHLYDAMIDTFRSSGVTRGAAIVQNVHTGEVLGLVSLPSFDPNFFEDSSDPHAADQINAWLTSKLRPLFNRAISGLYSPGSTIKPLFALAGLQEKVVTPSTMIYAGGSIEVPSAVDPSVTYTFRDWKVHGWTDIRKAIADSVDVYFYALGGGYQDVVGLGIDRIDRYLAMFRVDKKTSIDLPGEASGFIPGKQWKQDTKGESWFVGDTYNVSIGQGDLLVTPLWLTTYVSAIANGGSIIQPFLVKEIQNGDGTMREKHNPLTIAKLTLDSDSLRVVHEGMRQTVTAGTAQILQDLPVAVAAKTGTAQVTGKALNSLFIVYGPYESPDIAMTVLVEQIPQSQSIAVRVANSFLAWYFGNPRKN